MTYTSITSTLISTLLLASLPVALAQTLTGRTIINKTCVGSADKSRTSIPNKIQCCLPSTYRVDK